MASSTRPKSNVSSFDHPYRRSSSSSIFSASVRSSSSSSSRSGKSSSSSRFHIDHKSTSPSPHGRPISVSSNHKKKTCLCSPTTHPGSFRCSLHKNLTYSASQNDNRSYSCGSSNSLNFRRSAMTNSLVRIGGVEGGDLVKRALSALIRPSSNQLRRRLEFQPRPSRLSVMSKAED